MQINIKNKLSYRLKNGETLQEISSSLNMNLSELYSINGNIKNLSSGDVVLLGKAYEKCYVVKPLDTKENIAKCLGITVEQLINYTKIDKFYIGQKIMM